MKQLMNDINDVRHLNCMQLFDITLKKENFDPYSCSNIVIVYNVNMYINDIYLYGCMCYITYISVHTMTHIYIYINEVRDTVLQLSL